jgi:hypothetical protein
LGGGIVEKSSLPPFLSQIAGYSRFMNQIAPLFVLFALIAMMPIGQSRALLLLSRV